MNYELYEGDCLEVMKRLDAGSVDAVICDPPYGTTACAWDSVIPFAPMWECIKRVIKPRRAVVLFGLQPFTSALVMSNTQWFKYCWAWEKTIATNFLNSPNRPLTAHEDIAVFSSGTVANKSPNRMVYNPQIDATISGWRKVTGTRESSDGVFGRGNRKSHERGDIRERDGRMPRSIIRFANGNFNSLHPTQKPVALMSYLIKTYTNEGDTVLDFTMGSGSTIVAAIECGRNAIGIELDPHYYAVANERIEAAYRKAQGMPRLGKPTDHADLPLFAS